MNFQPCSTYVCSIDLPGWKWEYPFSDLIISLPTWQSQDWCASGSPRRNDPHIVNYTLLLQLTTSVISLEYSCFRHSLKFLPSMQSFTVFLTPLLIIATSFRIDDSGDSHIVLQRNASSFVTLSIHEVISTLLWNHISKDWGTCVCS